jgi:hypothetical protein
MIWTLLPSCRKWVRLALLIAIGCVAMQAPHMVLAQQLSTGTELPSQVSTMFSGTLRQKNLAALNDPCLPGTMVVYYSPGQKRRAKFLQDLLSGEMDFYANEFNVHFLPVTLAVLNPDQWKKVVIFAYGFPSMSRPPSIFTMPSDWSKSTAVPFPHKSDVDAATLKRIRVEGHRWEEFQYEGGDGIGTHEIGHSIIRQLAIVPQTHWFNEFLASYIGYAYLRAKAPKEILGNEIFWKVGYLNSPHPHTDLNYMETNYVDLTTKEQINYAWYQFALDQRLLEVYRQQGLNFLVKVKEGFPAGGPKLDTDQVLNKLEAIQPGWKKWAENLTATRLQSLLDN